MFTLRRSGLLASLLSLALVALGGGCDSGPAATPATDAPASGKLGDDKMAPMPTGPGKMGDDKMAPKG